MQILDDVLKINSLHEQYLIGHTLLAEFQAKLQHFKETEEVLPFTRSNYSKYVCVHFKNIHFGKCIAHEHTHALCNSKYCMHK